MESLKLNSGLALLNSSKVSSDAREQLVMEGQALVLESVGMAKNKALSKAQRPTVDFGSSFKSASDYEKWTDDVLHFCAKKVNDFNGTRTSRDEKATFTDPRLAANPMYLQLMSSVMNDVLYTTTPYVVNELVGDMVSTVTTPRPTRRGSPPTRCSSGMTPPGPPCAPCRKTSSTTRLSR